VHFARGFIHALAVIALAAFPAGFGAMAAPTQHVHTIGQANAGTHPGKTGIEAGGSRLAALHAKDGHDCLEHSSHCLHKGSGCTGGAALCCDAACHAMQQMADAAAIGGPLPLRRGIRLAADAKIDGYAATVHDRPPKS
jgi:hypothetical protein